MTVDPSTMNLEESFESPPHVPEGIEVSLLGERIRYLNPARAVRVLVETSVAEAIEVMKSQRIGALLVMDGKGGLAGIFTERDVLTRIAGSGAADLGAPLSRYMTSDPETLRLDDGIAYALNTMHLGGYRHVPVFDDVSREWHVVSVRDVARWVVELFPDAVLTLPPHSLPREPEKETGG